MFAARTTQCVRSKQRPKRTQYGIRSTSQFGILIARFVALTLAIPTFAQLPPTLEVTLQLSSDRILLGEPVWVLVTARNTSGVALRWNPGDYCNSTVPVSAVVPDAAPGKGTPQRCEYGAPPVSCAIGGYTTVLAPGASATWRFLLEGDFHFTRAGTYDVRLTSHPRKPFGSDTSATIASVVPVTQTRVLVVLPRNNAALLAREKQLAADVEADLRREMSFRDGANLWQVPRGLAAHPAPGMEPVFEHWLQLSNSFEDHAILGLKNLNTPASRAALATLARTPSKPSSYTQDGATRALADLGDRQYYPLMVQLLASRNERVRRAAVPGVANLGGENGVARLLDMVRAGGGNGLARDAVTALGNTKSRTAVKGLIDAMPRTEGPDGLGADWPLFILTHHRLPSVDVLRTAEQTHQAWLQWWETTGHSAPVYSPFECAPGAREPIR